MEINDKLIRDILDCNLLSRCGRIDDLGFAVKFIKKDEVKKIKSLNWKNLNLDVRGEFTSCLSVNYRPLYRNWNSLIDEIKENYIREIENEMRKYWHDDNTIEDVVRDARFNLLTLIMYDVYSEYYHDEYFEKMLKIYLSGHLPCGWSGNYPEGEFKVY